MSEHMRDDEMAAIERDLARLLSVAPSPEFAARVRTRIEQQPLRVFTRRRWLLMSAVAAVIVVALVMARRGTSVPPPVTPVQADRWLPPQLAPAPSVLPAAPTYAGTVPQHGVFVAGDWKVIKGRKFTGWVLTERPDDFMPQLDEITAKRFNQRTFTRPGKARDPDAQGLTGLGQ